MTDIELIGRKIKAIRKAIALGLELQAQHPEVAFLYMGGLSQREIVNELELQNKYGITMYVAKSAIGFAIRGYKGSKLAESYEGLIPAEERKKLEVEHKRENALATASIYSSIIGQRSARQGIGIHGLSKKVNWKIRSTGGKEGARSNGYEPWKPQEIVYILDESKKCLHPEGSRYGGSIDKKELTLRVNSMFPEVKRTEWAVRSILTKYKKTKYKRALEGMLSE